MATQRTLVWVFGTIAVRATCKLMVGTACSGCQSWIDGATKLVDYNWNDYQYTGWVENSFVPTTVVAQRDGPGVSALFPERHTFMFILAGTTMHQVKTNARAVVCYVCARSALGCVSANCGALPAVVSRRKFH